MESIEASLHKSHYAEFDIQLTKDNEIIVFHDRYLSKLTNVKELLEFENKKVEYVNDVMKATAKSDWWVKDFTLEELQKLKVYQKFSNRPQFRHQIFKICTLNELITEVLYLKEHNLIENNSGFLI